MTKLLYYIKQKEEKSFLVTLKDNLSPRKRLYYEDIKKIADPGSIFLLQSHLKDNILQNKDTLQCNEITLDQKNLSIFLKQVKADIFFNNKKVFFDKEPFNIYYNVKKQFKNLLVKASFIRGEKIIDIDKCDMLLIGKEIIFLYEGKFHLTSDLFDQKLIKKLKKGSIILSGNLKDEFISENKSKIIYQEEEKITILPILKITDDRGLFANLEFSYEGKRVVFYKNDLYPDKDRRDFSEENLFEKDLIDAGYSRWQNSYYCPLDKIYDVVKFLIELGWGVVKDNQQIVLQTDYTFFVDENFNVTADLSLGEEKVSLSSILPETKGSHFLNVSSEKIALLDKEFTNSPLLRQIDKDKKHTLGLLLLAAEDNKVILNEKMKSLALEYIDLSYIEPSSSFKGALYPYQKKSVGWFNFLSKYNLGALLADDMGLGKTVQVLAFFSLMRKKLPTLVVVPKSLIFNWQNEVNKFLPDQQVYVHSGLNRTKDSSTLMQHSLILTSYAILRTDIELLDKIEYESIILDEATYIKNPSSLLAKACFSLVSHFKIALTGTPIENSYKDLWSIFYFLMPGLLNKKLLSKNQNILTQDDISDIKMKIRPFILRRKKKEVGKDLPKLIEQVVFLQMSDEQKEVYEEYKKQIKDSKVDENAKILKAILKLRQICNHPCFANDSISIDSVKLNRIIEDIKEVEKEGNKVLVFSQFTSMLKLIEKELTKLDVSSLYLDGSINEKKRKDLVESFQTQDERVFLISLKAGGYGLNLTKADYVFIVEPWWNDAVENQAISRAHRIGGQEVLIAKRYIIEDSIEKKMLNLKKSKYFKAQNMMDLDYSLNLTKKDFLYLLD
jgi:SNF2 family DNA or RNA helicase